MNRLPSLARKAGGDKNVSGAVNQQERPRMSEESSETIRQAPLVTRNEIKAYLFGAMHDGWIRKSDRRYRIAQKGTEWLEVIQSMLASLEYRSWIYQEGKTRDVYILESVAPIFRESFDEYGLTNVREQRAYLKGFFDAEGGIPKNQNSKHYIQLTQKDYKKIELLKEMLTRSHIQSGTIHNPSKRIDPHYWRIFVSTRSIPDFVSRIGSLHPRKAAIFNQWMKI